MVLFGLNDRDERELEARDVLTGSKRMTGGREGGGGGPEANAWMEEDVAQSTD